MSQQTEKDAGDSQEWQGEHWSVVGPSWRGIENVRHLVIFGDSYSQTQPHGYWFKPTDEEPLGIRYPGLTSAGGANWVGHLVYERPHPMLVYNYAKSGHKVAGIRDQIQAKFSGTHPPSETLAPETSMFMTWVGINDLASSADVGRMIDNLFVLQQYLYDKGARNFLFIDVPPVDRSPAYRNLTKRDGPSRMVLWNIELERRLRAFAAEKEAAGGPITAAYFSSHKVFTTFLDDPEEYGFPKSDVRRSGGEIWVDDLHPTPAVHAIIAKELDDMLNGIAVTTSQTDNI
ncbi:hypothetical protein FRC14_003689 [Serendipita sp. 396]|nr:hypothetical protein FRC14_003689 [Serendipita sp. 396]KAG8783064.1 hypothetical protein FRC15_005871 [Serendipita sp. 397]KAG8799047.1 hypothetical protein FRC16_005930 [Serendipita sp. 398]KAG8831853.1 hypothetical protein FRC18_005853 [Serendipita sp. 400]KAG8867276.1 hypothetical protein FRC20_006210 [Serendipita sp. 405]